MQVRLPLILGGALILGLLFAVVVLYFVYTTVSGTGRIQSETREVSGFTAVNFPGAGEMTIIQGDTEGLTIEASENVLRHIDATVRDGTLTIRMNNRLRLPWIFLRSSPRIRYTLYVRDLEAFDLSGAGTVHANPLSVDRLSLAESGAGQITVDNLTVDDLAVTISGAGSVKLTGRTTSQTVKLSGLGRYNAADLESQNAQINLSGAGSVTAWVHGQLTVNLSGAGSVEYYGAPQVTSSTSGAGSVRHLGER